MGLLLLITVLTISNLAVVYGQSSTGSLSGLVSDERDAVITNATVSAKNVQTGISRTAQTNGEGRFNFVSMPIGLYSITVEASNFSKFVQNGITLDVNQNAVLDIKLKAGRVEEVVTVSENATVLNTTTAEISTRFDEKRLSELPIATNRNVFNVLLSVPGVSQLGSGQTGFANGISFSANGGRLRSNSFTVDGQDINDPSVSGGQIALNNPDAIQEVRIITNQFLAEYGRNSGSVVNFVGKSGTNNFHGSAFWFHNNQRFNACSNQDKAGGFCNSAATTTSLKSAPRRLENQLGFTFGGPLTLPAFGEGTPYFRSGKDKTFFFGDYQNWSDRALGSGFTLNGAPTAAGRQVLQSVVGNRPQIQALLNFVQPGTPNGQSVNFVVAGTTYNVPLGNLTGSSAFKFDDKQGSFRIDHKLNDKNLFYGRYRFDSALTSGTGQVTPIGLTNENKLSSKAATFVLNSILSSNVSNEFRLAYTRYDSVTNASNPSAESIPSIEISELGMTGFNAAANRTAIGLAVNLPQFRVNNTYQFTDNLSYLTGNHNLKFGVDFRKTEVKSFFFPTVRGRLAYSSLQNYVDDVANLASTVNRPLTGGDRVGFYDWNELYGFAQDEWKIARNFTLTYGLRYEFPGNSFSYLEELGKRTLAASGNNSAFVFTPVPKIDKNNFMPRIGFNWNPRTRDTGILGFITGGEKLVLRGGYSRNYDASFININLNVFSSFPFVASGNLPAAGAFAAISSFTPSLSNPNALTRTIVGGDFRAPASDQLSFEIQRELTKDTVFKISYIGTRGSGLFQTIDGNPRRNNVTPASCVSFGPLNPTDSCRVDPIRGVIRLRANTASSNYHSMQVSFDKRLSNNFSAGFHYTWSTFIDTASEIFNPSGAEVAIAQDSFNINSDRSRSSYDRPHRFTGNFVYQIPVFKDQSGFAGKILGGWQVNSFFSIQSGAPFTALNGSDLGGALSGIDGLVGSAIRPNLTTSTNLSGLTISEVLSLCGTAITGNRCPGLFGITSAAQRVGNAGRNILRADKFKNIDFGIIKNTKISETVRVQFRVDMFNATNSRNFGTPEGRVNSASFLNKWATNGGNRRVNLGLRLVF